MEYLEYVLLDKNTPYQIGDESLRIRRGTYEHDWLPVPQWAIGQCGKLITVRRPFNLLDKTVDLSMEYLNLKGKSSVKIYTVMGEFVEWIQEKKNTEACSVCHKTGGSHDLDCTHPSCVNS